MAKLPFYDGEGKSTGEISVSKEVFGRELAGAA